MISERNPNPRAACSRRPRRRERAAMIRLRLGNSPARGRVPKGASLTSAPPPATTSSKSGSGCCKVEDGPDLRPRHDDRPPSAPMHPSARPHQFPSAPPDTMKHPPSAAGAEPSSVAKESHTASHVANQTTRRRRPRKIRDCPERRASLPAGTSAQVVRANRDLPGAVPRSRRAPDPRALARPSLSCSWDSTKRGLQRAMASAQGLKI